MKTNKRRTQRRKLAIVALFLSLMFGASIYGTYAYFKSSAQISGNVTVTTGNIKVEALNTDAWKYVPDQNNPDINGNGNFSGQADLNVNNIRPGDAFTKTVTVRNAGSLTQNLTLVKGNALASLAGSPFRFTISSNVSLQDLPDGSGWTLNNVKPGQEIIITLSLALPAETQNGASGNSNEYNKDTPNSFGINLNGTFLQITATQPNAR